MNETRRKKISSVVEKRQSGIIVVLEDIHDPHNAAAILRTCDGLGIQNVYFIFEKEIEYNPQKIGKASSSSANKWLDFTIFNSAKECFTSLRHDGYTIIVTALSEKSESLRDAIFPETKIAVVVGNEKTGISQHASNFADRTLMIPMKGFVQSFNVSVATAILLWEVTKQRDGKFPLSKIQQQKLLTEYIKRSGK